MMRSSVPKQSSFAGFSMVEALVAVVIIGILAAIAVPSWMRLMTNQRVSRAQEEAYQAFREARFNAQREKRSWQVIFQETADPDKVEYSVHRKPDPDDNDPDLNWQELTSDAETIVILDSYSNLSNITVGEDNKYSGIEFRHDGIVSQDINEDEPPRITFKPKDRESPLYCVLVTTKLGAIRRDNGDSCSIQN